MIAPLSVRDAQWAGTLPHRVTPQPTEWLPGLLLRADIANGWLGADNDSLVFGPFDHNHDLTPRCVEGPSDRERVEVRCAQM